MCDEIMKNNERRITKEEEEAAEEKNDEELQPPQKKMTPPLPSVLRPRVFLRWALGRHRVAITIL